METIDMHTIRTALTREMEAKGVAPTKLSLAVGTNRTLVKNLLEKNQDVTIGTLVKLAEALDVPVQRLLVADLATLNAERAPSATVPTPDIVAELLAVAMQVGEDDLIKHGEIADYANAVCIGLKWLAEEPASSGDPGYLKAVRKRVTEAVELQRSQPSQTA